MKERVLVLTTDLYPYGHSELLFSENINSISKEFDFVEIFSLCPNESVQYNLPVNVLSHNLHSNYRRSKYFSKFLIFFIKSCFGEFKFLQRNNTKFSLQLLKVFVKSIFNALHYSYHIDSILKKYDYQKVDFYFQSYWCNDLYIALLMLKQNGKLETNLISSYLHGYDLVWERHSPKYLPLRWYIERNSDILFFVSEYGKKYFQSKFDKITSQLIVNYLGVSRLFSINKNSIYNYRIVSCSRLIPLKRIHLLIESLALINDLNLEWVHFGSGEIEDEILQLAYERLNLKNNISYNFMGNVNNVTIQEYYALNQVDLFCNVSEYEGVPISIMEAMAYGIPCLATDVGGVSEIVNFQNGILIEKNSSASQIKDYILTFLLQSQEKKKHYIDEAISCWERNFNCKTNFTKYIEYSKRIS